MAKANGYQTTLLEAHDEKPLGELIYPALRSLLFELEGVAGAGNKVKRGLAVLRSSVGSIKVTVGDVALGLDIEPARGLPTAAISKSTCRTCLWLSLKRRKNGTARLLFW